jgi:hypothetical protein
VPLAFPAAGWIALLALTIAASATAQSKPDPRVYSAFIKNGPIVEATITTIKPSAPGSETGTLAIEVTGELRGHLQKKQFEIPYSTHLNPKYPPFVWERAAPVAGHHVVLFLIEQQGLTYADEVLDLDAGEQKYMPKLQALLALEKQGASGDVKPLLDDLGSADQDIRSLASRLLLDKRCMAPAPCRAETLDKLTAIAHDRSRPKAERVWAVVQIGHNVYLGIPASAATDQAAANALTGLLVDPETAIRDEAVQDLHGLLLGGGTAKPKIELSAAERTKVVEQLNKDAQAGLAYSSKARELSELIARP